MHPVLFRVAGFFVPAYLVAQLLALGVAALWLHLRRHELDLPASVGLDMTLLGFLSVFVGGRLASLFRGSSEGLMGLVAPSGFAFVGVLIVAMAGSALYARYHQRGVLSVWDAMAPAIPLALIPYRLGCLAAGCCYGTPSDLPWSIRYPESWLHYAGGLPRHPVPLYEALLGVACFLVLRRVQFWSGRRLGDVTTAFILVLAPIRFMTDLVREDASLRIAAFTDVVLLTHAQWCCSLGTPIALIAWSRRSRAQVVAAQDPSAP